MKENHSGAKMIYLACPFTHRFFWVRWWRFIVACRCAAKLMKDRHIVFSPISHSFPIACFLSRKYMTCHTHWMFQDIPFVGVCDYMVVISFSGAYRRSKGVVEEMGEAYELYKPLFVFEAKKILSGAYQWDFDNC